MTTRTTTATTTKMRWALAATAAAVALGWAGAAFACSPMPRVYSVLPESAAPGATVTVEGREIQGDAPVEIRWNGVRGDVLATAAPGPNGAFSVPVQIPEAAPGIYSLTLVAPGTAVGRTAFEVTAPAGSAVAPAPAPALWPTAAERPSMAAPAPAAGGPGRAGVGLLGAGLVALAAGSTVAAARRRRVPVGAGS